MAYRETTTYTCDQCGKEECDEQVVKRSWGVVVSPQTDENEYVRWDFCSLACAAAFLAARVKEQA